MSLFWGWSKGLILLLLVIIYVAVGSYVVFHLREISTIYDWVFKGLQRDLLTKCASLNDYSCPSAMSSLSAQQNNSHAFTESAVWWRLHCREVVDEVSMVEDSLQFENRAIEQAIIKYQDRESKTWHHIPTLHEVVYWLLRHRAMAFPISVLLNLLLLCILILAPFSSCSRKGGRTLSSIPSPPPPLTIRNPQLPTPRPINLLSTVPYSLAPTPTNGLHHRSTTTTTS